MRKMVGKAIEKPPKLEHQEARTLEKIEQETSPKEVWVWKKEEFTD